MDEFLYRKKGKVMLKGIKKKLKKAFTGVIAAMTTSHIKQNPL